MFNLEHPATPLYVRRQALYNKRGKKDEEGGHSDGGSTANRKKGLFTGRGFWRRNGGKGGETALPGLGPTLGVGISHHRGERGGGDAH